MSSEPAIRVDRVSKVYALGRSGRTRSFARILGDQVRRGTRGGVQREQFRALDEVSFEVAPGEVVGVVGKNGAGKSTLLKLLSRITFPTSGHIDLVGRVGSLLEVGTGFHPELTGLENVYLNGAILGMSEREIDGRLDEIVEFSEVGQFLGTPVKRYSSGMRVRLAFAVAAHLEPEVLIIDEVLSVGDAGFQAKCLEKMRSIADEDGRTVLYVSHNLATLENLCPRTLVIEGGRLIFDGPTAESVIRYLETFPRGARGRSAGVFDFTGADRSGTQYQEVFRRLVLRPGGGDPSEVVRMGDRMRVEIDVRGLDEEPDPFMMVTCKSGLGQRVFRINTNMSRLVAAAPRQADERIVLDLPSLPLTPGEYSLELQLKGRSGTIDYMGQAASFKVVPVDAMGSGYRFSAEDGHVVIPWEWELLPAVDDDASLRIAGGSKA